MDRIKANSSMISELGYDSEKCILEIKFGSGVTYQYFDVPQKIYRDFSESGALGRYFMKYIKGKYDSIILDGRKFREFEFKRYILRMLKANVNFSKISSSGTLETKEKKKFYPDILCEREGKKLILEVKNEASLTLNRVNEYLFQLKKYQSLEDYHTVIIFPDELQSGYEQLFIDNNIEVWDTSVLAMIFKNELKFIKDTPLYPILYRAGLYVGKKSDSSNYVDELKSIQAGKKQWNAYQRVVKDIFEYLFNPPLSKAYYESSDEQKINRRDIVFPNYSVNGLWKFLSEKYLADFIVIDTKNYKNQVQKKDVLQISNYLKEFGTGLFGIIVSRKVPHNNAKATQREQWMVYKKMIIFLDDEDIIQMLTMKEKSGNPEDVIRQKIEDFRLNL